jgi:actin-binding protein IPP
LLPSFQINDLVSRRGSLVCLNAAPRACARKVIYVFGGAKREMSCHWTRHECTLDTVVALDTCSLEWKHVSSMDIGRIHPGVCVMDGKIFIFGGEQESQILANGEVSRVDLVFLFFDNSSLERASHAL